MAKKINNQETDIIEVRGPRDELEVAIRARYPLIALTTWDVEVVLEELRRMAEEQDKFLLTWTQTGGLRIDTTLPGKNGEEWSFTYDGQYVFAVDKNNKERKLTLGSIEEWGLPPAELSTESVIALKSALSFQAPLDRIEALKTGGVQPGRSKKPVRQAIFVMFGLENYLASPEIKQLLWDASREWENTRKTLVMVAPIITLPPEITKLIMLINWPLPNRQELAELVKEDARIFKDKLMMPVDMDSEGFLTVAKALQGMSYFEAGRALKKVMVERRLLDATDGTLNSLRAHKKALVEKEGGALEYWEGDVTNEQIGGLDALKQYILEAGVVFEDDALEFAGGGNIASRGVMVGGPPGTGKSLVAKAIAQYLRLPLVRLDFGKMFGPLLGQSEANQRQVFDIVEAIAPCVLWLDELEKGNATGGGETDGGTSARLLGAFLTWSEEIVRTKGVFMVATANFVDRIDPALLSRFSDRFVVDLPGPQAREDIMRIHLAKFQRNDPEAIGINIAELVDITRGYSGREMMEATLAAMRRAYLDRKNGECDDLTHEHLACAIREIVPLSKQRDAEIRSLRRWGKTARQASTEAFDGLDNDLTATAEQPTIDAQQFAEGYGAEFDTGSR